MLMSELNHRVKNHLNMITSLISLKEQELENEVDLSDISSHPPHIDVDNAGTLGLQLISSLADKLSGSIKLQKSPEPVFTIRIPRDKS